MNEACLKFWQKFKLENNLNNLPDPPTWFFCNTEEPAARLARLVAEGIKTATCSLLEDYEEENEPLPVVGSFHLITDFHGNPSSIIQIISVTKRPYNKVTAEFAFKEGEGDRSLAYWRRVHWEFFTPFFAKRNRQAQEDMMLVCEEFECLAVFEL